MQPAPFASSSSPCPDPTSRSSCPRLSRASTSFAAQIKAWMAGTSPTMTPRSIYEWNMNLAAPRAGRILHVLDLVEDDVDELAADFLYPPDIDGLHHIAGIGIDRHRPARAVPLQALGRRDQSIAIGVAARLLQRLVDGMHAVIAADCEEVRIAPVHFVEHLDELGIERGVVLVIVMPRRDDAEAGIAHYLERLLRRCLARSQHLGLRSEVRRV